MNERSPLGVRGYLRLTVVEPQGPRRRRTSRQAGVGELWVGKACLKGVKVGIDLASFNDLSGREGDRSGDIGLNNAERQ